MDNTNLNLRAVPKSEQCQNRKRFSNNTSGVTGVTYQKDQDRFAAYGMTENGLQREYFPLKKYGGFDNAFKEAVIARNKGVSNSIIYNKKTF